MRRPTGIGLVVALLLSTVLIPGQGVSAGIDPLGASRELDPTDIYAWSDGRLVLREGEIPRPAGMDRELAELITQSLNDALSFGHVLIDDNFKVTVTKEGVDYWTKAIDEGSGGCLSVESVTADWAGVVVMTSATEECDPLLVAASAAKLGFDSKKSGEGRIRPLINSSGTPGSNCAWAAASYVATTINLFLFIASPPIGALAWVGVATINGFGYVMGAYAMSQACNGAHGARTQNWNYCSWYRSSYNYPFYRGFRANCYNP